MRWFVVMAVLPALASAADLDDPGAQWLPRTDGAQWTYTWSDSAYAPVARTEHYALDQRDDRDFRIAWSELGVPADQEPIAGCDGLPDHRRRPGQRQLPVHARAAALPAAVPDRGAVRQQRSPAACS